jgi:predicted P-loop ATPase
MTYQEETASVAADAVQGRDVMLLLPEDSAPEECPRQAEPMLAAALAYAARGWAVFPLHTIVDGRCSCGTVDCSDAGKHPRVRRGLKEATRDRAKIEAWFGPGAPAANVGLATGAVSGVTVLDVDIGEGKRGAETWAELVKEQGEPETLTARTGSGGMHLFFRYNSALKTASNVLGPGVDCRNDGGYIVAPPSLHRSGGVYAWEHEAPLADLPAHLTKKKEARSKKERAAPHYTLPQVAAMLAVVPADDRDLWRAVGIILGRTFNRSDEAWDVYNEWSATWDGKPGRNHDETMRQAFYEISQQETEQELSLGTIIKLAREHGWGGRGGDNMALLQGDANATSVWEALVLEPNGRFVANTIANAALLLHSQLSRHGALLWWDTFSRRVLLKRVGGAAEEVEDAHVLDWAARLQMDEQTHRLKLETMQQAVNLIAHQNENDSVRQVLDGFVWDGVPRLDQLLPLGFGTAADEYTAAAGANLLVAATARQYRPGAKVDTMPVFEGGQGILKSTALRALFGDPWFSDSLQHFDNEHFARQLRGKVCFEVADLSQIHKADVERVKQLLTTQIDRYRDPYARREIEVPRRCVFVGTTNEDAGYLKDQTGNRRFIPVRCGTINLPWLTEHREQLWAEAVALFRAGREWWQYPKEQTEREQEERREQHGIEEKVLDWSADEKNALITHVRALDVGERVLDLKVAQLHTGVNKQIAGALRRAGWVALGQTTVGKAPGRWYRRAQWNYGDKICPAHETF